MDAPHDLGGRAGYGPVPVAADRPWSAHWQQRAYVLASITARAAGVNGDALRHLMETIPAADYSRLGSAGRWLRVAERAALEGGLVADGEVTDRAKRRVQRLEPRLVSDYPEPVATRPFRHGAAAHNKRDPIEAPDPLFRLGDVVTVRDLRPAGHTRLPGYLRGRSGTVIRHNGYWVFPDTHAEDGTEAPTWVYAVRFSADQLWPGAGSHHVCADLFEPYLEVPDG